MSSVIRPFHGIAMIALFVVFLACGPSESTVESSDASTPEPATAAPTSTPSAEATPLENPCEIVTAAELADAAGVASGATATQGVSGGANTCTWQGGTGPAVIVQIYSDSWSYDQARSTFEGFYNGKSAPISGLGDDAFYIAGRTGPFMTATVTTRNARRTVSAQVFDPMNPESELRSAAEKVARLTIEKL